MSVPENARTKSKLEVNVKAHELCCYTLQITANKKIFTENYQRSLTDRIVSVAIGIHVDCWNANNIYVKCAEDYYDKKSKSGGIPRHKVNESYAAWRNHASKGNCFKCIQRMDAYYKSLWGE